jgi:hypothetical protein
MTNEERDQCRKEIYAWTLQCMTELAGRFESDGPPPALTATIDLLDRTDGPRGPRVAFAGRFSAGKTTLVNNVLGGRVLMEGMTETTAIPTRVRRGESERLLLKKSMDAWYQASEGERQEFLKLRAAEMSPLIRKYLEQQDEVIFEHPAMPEGLEVVDLPGVSSTFQNVELRALQSLQYANGVVWVANANQGGLTRADLEYVQRNIPVETPRLFVLTHLDLLPPSRRQSVLTSAEGAVKGMQNVVAVVGTSRDVSIASDPEIRPRWLALLKNARANNRLKPLVEQVTGILQGLQDDMKKETVEETQELIDAVGLSKDAFRRYLDKLFAEYRSALGSLNALVDGSEHVFGFHLNSDPVMALCSERMERVYKSGDKAIEKVVADFNRVREKGAGGSESVLGALTSCWKWAASSFANNICVAMQTAATIGWRFETPMANGGDIAGAFKEMWNWGTIKEMTCDPLLEGYDTVFENAVDALQEHHKLRELYETGMIICSAEGLLDELGGF